METITLSICTKNEEERIGRCLDSVLEQTVLPNELQIADYQSTDRTLEIATVKMKSLVERGCRARILKLTTPGIGYAREESRKRALGSIFMTTDGDAQLKPNVIEKVLNHFEDPRVIMVIGAGMPEKWDFNTLTAFWGEMLYPGGKGYCMAFRVNSGLKYTLLRTDLENDPLCWHEDTQIYWDALAQLVQGKKIIYDPSIMVVCRMPTTGSKWVWKQMGLEEFVKEGGLFYFNNLQHL